MKSRAKKETTLVLALIPILGMLLLLGVGIGAFGLPAEPLIVMATVISGFVAIYLGYSFDDIMDSISEKISKTWGALLILIVVGLMIGSWMIGGTIPMLIYYGLKLINPNYLALTALIVTAIVSVMTGTSWGSAGTIGVAFMGVAVGMDANLAMVGGAVVSGAYFGDKLSPLSDSTNLAAVSTGVDLYEHIKNQLWTTGPSFLIAATVFFVSGLMLGNGNAEVPQTVYTLMDSLKGSFNWNILYILPLVIVLVGSATQKPTIPVMLLASAVALLNGLIFEGANIVNLVEATLNGFNVSMIGLDAATASPELVKLLHRGGMMSMMNTLLIAICAISFAGTMTVTGSLEVIIQRLLKHVNSPFKLIATTVAICLVVIGVTSNGQVSILMPGEALTDAYKQRGIHPKVLSRTIEDSVTVIEPLMPWTAAGAYMATTLGVATLSYLPWAIFNYLGIVFALIWAATGIGITKYNVEDEQEKQ